MTPATDASSADATALTGNADDSPMMAATDGRGPTAIVMDDFESGR